MNRSIRPLSHPGIESITVAGILHALADPVRLAIVRQLIAKPDGASCIETMAGVDPDIPNSTWSQHFQILREAGLVHSDRKGVEHVNRLRLAEIDKRFPGLIRSVISAYDAEAKQRR